MNPLIIKMNFAKKSKNPKNYQGPLYPSISCVLLLSHDREYKRPFVQYDCNILQGLEGGNLVISYKMVMVSNTIALYTILRDTFL
jgi:hypothetical protein